MCHIKTALIIQTISYKNLGMVCIGWKLFKKSNNFNLYKYAKKSRITI